MNRIDLELIPHDKKVGQHCGNIEPNITEDAVFYENGKPVGFYIKNLADYSEAAAKLAAIADRELRSSRVPKSEMRRSSGLRNTELEVRQYSVILGGVPPKPHMRRNYPTVSSVHAVKSAQNFVKSMLLLCSESEAIIKSIMPEQYELQKRLISENAPPQYRFGELFTSSISNFNIAAAYHVDNANLRGCANVIITKRKSSYGGNTNIPDYGATVDSCDNSMLVYPAWKSLHGVTPIIPTAEGGYRNSLVFYPLKSFASYM